MIIVWPGSFHAGVSSHRLWSDVVIGTTVGSSESQDWAQTYAEAGADARARRSAPPPEVAVVAINERDIAGLGLPKLPRDEIIVQTKVPPFADPADFVRDFEAQHPQTQPRPGQRRSETAAAHADHDEVIPVARCGPRGKHAPRA